MTRHPLLLASMGLLAACGGDNTVKEQPTDARTARGEVLGGTISDDMLPLDTRRSQSPPLQEEKSSSRSITSSSNEASATSSEVPTERDPQPAPATPVDETAEDEG